MFFKLLDSASLLQACMMFKYVSQMRVAALSALVRSYFVPGAAGSRTSFPIAIIADMLYFGSEDEARGFVEYCGLDVCNHVHSY